MLDAATELETLQVCHPIIDSMRSKANAKGSIVFASTTHGVFVFAGLAVTPMMLRSWITIRIRAMKKNLPPIRPGEVLLEEFLQPMEISQYRLAKDTGLAPRRVNEIVHGKRAITANSALRWGRHHEEVTQSGSNYGVLPFGFLTQRKPIWDRPVS